MTLKLSDHTASLIIYTLMSLVLILGGLVLRGSPAHVVEVDQSEEKINIEDIEKPPSPFLADEEVVVVTASTTEQTVELLPVEKVVFEYVEVVDSCDAHYEGDCLLVRSGPGVEYPIQSRLRNGVVLKVGGMVERDGQRWLKIVFDEWLRYPERVKGDWYLAGDYVRILLDEGDRTIWEHDYSTTTKKTITVNRSEQKLYAFEGNELFLETDISTGLELTPTPRGSFTIFKKTPSRYMQGPLPNLIDKQYYDLPGVPWNLYFTDGGAVIHGAYWHDSFGSQYSHGCVNLEPKTAERLYNWAELGTEVIVKD
ncbi:L,D-transpeptidase family protein [Candidatus Kaiserbacteria bacterium]|nr:L,D-transpeptidase family protein [Candidatus Kaiserbacteria bacterium]